MIKLERLKIQCPECNKLICSMDYNANPQGIYFWCPRCKKEFEINNRAHEANDR